MAWVGAAIDAAGGGKSGGKPPRGQGMAENLDKIDDALAAAKKFAGL